MRYKEISKTFLNFTVDHAVGSIDTKVWFKDSIECGYINVARLKLEILKANQSNSFSWKKIAYEKEFYTYHPDATEAEIFFNFQFLTWEILYPEIKLNEETALRLKEWLIHNLPADKWKNLDDIVEALKKDALEWKNINKLTLFIFKGDKARSLSDIDVDVEYGTNKIFFRLHSIEEQQLSGRVRVRFSRKRVKERREAP